MRTLRPGKYELSKVTRLISGQISIWTTFALFQRLDCFHSTRLSSMLSLSWKGVGMVFWLLWLHALRLKGGLLPSRRNGHFLLAPGDRGRSLIICHYLLLGASSRLREPVPSSEPREFPLVGFLLPVLWLQQKAKKPHNYLYLFENRSDHICLPCWKQNKQWYYRHAPLPTTHQEKQNVQWLPMKQ